LARRRRDGAALIVMALTAGQYLFVRFAVVRLGWIADTVAETLLLDAALIAGAFAAELDEGAAADAGARLVVLVQRRPWITSLVGALVIAALAGPWAWDWYPIHDEIDGVAVVPLV